MNILVKCILLSLCIFMFVASTESRKSLVYVPLTDDLCIRWHNFTDEEYEKVLEAPIKSANHTEDESDECDGIIPKKEEKKCTCLEDVGLDPKHIEEYKKLKPVDKNESPIEEEDSPKTNGDEEDVNTHEKHDEDEKDKKPNVPTRSVEAEEGSSTSSKREDSESEEFDASSEEAVSQHRAHGQQENDLQNIDEKQTDIPENNRAHENKTAESTGDKTDKGTSPDERDSKIIKKEDKTQNGEISKEKSADEASVKGKNDTNETEHDKKGEKEETKKSNNLDDQKTQQDSSQHDRSPDSGTSRHDDDDDDDDDIDDDDDDNEDSDSVEYANSDEDKK